MTRERYILFHCPGTTDQSFFDENSRDNCHEPFIALKRRCAELGFVLETTKEQNLDDCEWVVFWDVPSIGPAGLGRKHGRGMRRPLQGDTVRDIYSEAIVKGYGDRLALMLCEPVSVIPENGDASAHMKFERVFTWDCALVDGHRYIRTYLPVTAVYPEVPTVPFAQKKMLLDISGNKRSVHPRELYSERRETIGFFDREYPSDFDLYGVGWNVHPPTGLWSKIVRRAPAEAVYRTYRGTVHHKWEVLPKYKFNICYENIRGERDYVSQRIFDVLRCGCVPVYLGAPNIDDYVDKEAFLDRRRFASNEELARYMSNISESEYNRFLEAGRDYLASEKFRLFLSPNFVDTFVGALNLEST